MKSFKTYFNVTLLLTTLIVLSGAGCDSFEKVRNLFKCCQDSKTCQQAKNDSIVTSEKNKTTDSSPALITVEDKTVFTRNDLNNICQEAIEGNDQAAMLFQFYPQMTRQLFLQQIVPMEISRIWAEKENKLNDPKLQEKIEKACKNIKAGLIHELFQEEVLKNIDKSDKNLEEFYNKNKTTIPVLQRTMFLKHPALFTALQVEFDKEEDADKFLEKAKDNKSDFNTLAKQNNKTVTELKDISSETKDIDNAIISKIESMPVNQAEKVSLKDKFIVLKVTDKKPLEHISYEEIKNNPQLKNTVQHLMLQVLGTEAVNNKIEELKKKYNIKINTQDLDKEIEDRMKAIQEQYSAQDEDEEDQDEEDDQNTKIENTQDLKQDEEESQEELEEKNIEK